MVDDLLADYYRQLKSLPADSPIFNEHSAENLLESLTKRYFLSDRYFEESGRDEERDFSFNIGYQWDNLASVCAISWQLARNNINPLLINDTAIINGSLLVNNREISALLGRLAALFKQQLSPAQRDKIKELLQNSHYALNLDKLAASLREIIAPR